jgi:DNA polymerase-3 subunit chi
MAPEVDFYVLADTDGRGRLLQACGLIEKAYRQNLTVCACLDSSSDLELLSELLWTFEDRRFIPHERITNPDETRIGPPPATPVWLGSTVSVTADLLVNLSETLPTGYQHFPRIAERVDADPKRRDAGRRRFVAYRDAGIIPQTHRLNA